MCPYKLQPTNEMNDSYNLMISFIWNIDLRHRINLVLTRVICCQRNRGSTYYYMQYHWQTCSMCDVFSVCAMCNTVGIVVQSLISSWYVIIWINRVRLCMCCLSEWLEWHWMPRANCIFFSVQCSPHILHSHAHFILQNSERPLGIKNRQMLSAYCWTSYCFSILLCVFFFFGLLFSTS